MRNFMLATRTDSLAMLKILVHFCLLLLCLSLIGCKKSTPPPPAEKVIEQCLQAGGDPGHGFQSAREIKVYVDGSISMRGFVKRQGNTSFNRLLSALASFSPADYSIRFFKFGDGEPRSLNQDRFWRMSRDRNMFDQSTTRLDLLINAIRNNPAPSGAYLVITDGVQESPAGSNYPSFVRPISEWLADGKHPDLSIFAFKSEFQGAIYPANTGGRFNYNGDRPFYLYAFLLDDALEEELTRNIARASANNFHMLDFSGPIRKKDGEMDFELPARIGRVKNRLRRYCKIKQARGKTVIFLRWLNMIREEASGQGYLRVDFSEDLTEFARDVLHDLDSNLKTEVQIWSWERKKKVTKTTKGGTKTNYIWTAEQISNEGAYLSQVESGSRSRLKANDPHKLSATFRFQKMPEPGWYTYYIRVLPADDAFQVPSWVEEWSTEDDSLPENANRTLNLSNVVFPILNNAPIRKMALADFFAIVNFR